PPFGSANDTLLSEGEVREMTKGLGDLPAAPWQFYARPPRWGLARYNRVEGLSLGARGELDLGKIRLDGTGRIATTDGTFDVDGGIVRETGNARMRLGGYYRLTAVDPNARSLGLGSGGDDRAAGDTAAALYRSPLRRAAAIREEVDRRLASARHQERARLPAEHHRRLGQSVRRVGHAARAAGHRSGATTVDGGRDARRRARNVRVRPREQHVARHRSARPADRRGAGARRRHVRRRGAGAKLLVSRRAGHDARLRRQRGERRCVLARAPRAREPLARGAGRDLQRRRPRRSARSALAHASADRHRRGRELCGRPDPHRLHARDTIAHGLATGYLQRRCAVRLERWTVGLSGCNLPAPLRARAVAEPVLQDTDKTK